jgi:hypothetical protein
MASTSRGICGNSDASIDARSWTTVYHHNGTTFYGFSDNKPLTVLLTNQSARCVRIQLPGNDH